MSLHPLLIGDLKDTFAQWQTKHAYSAYFLICDTHTHLHCAPVFFEKTGLPSNMPFIAIHPGETHKNLDTCQQIWSAMFNAGLDRKALVVNLGGGVVGDMGGFCAATYKRGVDFLQIPTTLLSATDASVGGKLGIDYHGFKNAVGVFQNPAAVFLDASFLNTLPQRELHSGFAEVVKHALIGAPGLWEILRPLNHLNEIDWNAVLQDSVAVKIRVVEEDPLEKGLRAILNYGHTIGHALESYFLNTAMPLTHGEAIAWGMVCESRIWEMQTGKTLGMVSSDELEAYFERFYPIRTLPAGALEAIWALMHQDKKNSSGQIKMALPGKNLFELNWVTPQKTELERVLETD